MTIFKTITAGTLCSLLLFSLATLTGCAPKLPENYDLNAWWQAVESGKTDVVAEGLKLGVSPDTPNAKGYTPLHQALRMNRPATAAQLIRFGANINQVAPDGLTPLLYAIYNDQPGIIRLLSEHGVEVSGQNRYGQSPLQLAMARAYPSVIIELAMAGSEVRKQLQSELESSRIEQDSKQEISALIETQVTLRQPEDEEHYWQAFETLYGRMENKKDSGLSTLYMVETMMDEKSPAYSPDRAVSLIDDIRLHGLREHKQPLLNRWAMSGNSYAQAILGNGLVSSSTVNDRPLGRQLMLQSACQGNPLARIIINDDLRRYLPEFSYQLAALLAKDPEHPLTAAELENLDPEEFLAHNAYFNQQLAPIQNLASCGVVQAEAIDDLLKTHKFSTIRELLAQLALLAETDLETYPEVAIHYLDEENNGDAGMRWLKKAEAAAISGKQMNELGQLYETGHGDCQPAAKKALDWYLKAEEMGSYDAFERLAKAYLYGELGVEQDILKGLEYYHSNGGWEFQEKVKELGPDALKAVITAKDNEQLKQWLKLLGPDREVTLSAWAETLKSGDPGQCQLFVDAGVDPVRDIAGRSPLLIVSTNGQAATLDWLLSTSQKNAGPQLGQALMAATRAKKDDNVKLLLKHGARFPAVTTSQGMALIKQARTKPDTELLGLILENQPDGIGEGQIAQAMAQLAQEDLATVELAQWQAGMTVVRYDTQGEVLNDGARVDGDTPWRCAGDEKSGLVWLVKDKTEGIHGNDMTFSSADTTAQECTTENCTPTGYRDLARKQNLCGYNDWRIATVTELESLAYPYMAQAFPTWPGYMQWAVANSGGDLLLVYANGLLGHRSSVMAFGGAYGQVLLVRGQQQPLPESPQPDFMLMSVQ